MTSRSTSSTATCRDRSSQTRPFSTRPETVVDDLGTLGTHGLIGLRLDDERRASDPSETVASRPHQVSELCGSSHRGTVVLLLILPHLRWGGNGWVGSVDTHAAPVETGETRLAVPD